MTAPGTTEDTKLVGAAPVSFGFTGAVVGGTGDDCEGTSRGYEPSGTGGGGKVEEAMGATSGRWRGGGGGESEEGV